MVRVVRDFCILATILLLVAVPARAQLATAELNGRVTDSSGAVLPGATITVTQTATGLVRTAVTDGSGTYLFSNLPTGPYRLEVALQGFRTYVQTGIVLQVGATPTINAVLALGALEESITVEGAAPLVDVRSAGISNVIENQRILELPLNGRNLWISSQRRRRGPDGERQARGFPGEVNISVAGGLSTGVGYTLDGAAHNNPQQNTQPPAPVPRRAAGIPRRDERSLRAERRALGRGGQRDHQIGVEPVLTATRSSSCATSLQRHQPLRRRRSGRQEAGRRTEAQSVRRHPRRADRQEQAVLLAGVSGNDDAAAPDVEHRVCADGRHAGR